MYAGLTTADKPALLDAKARGAEWVARDQYHDRAWGYKDKPAKYENLWAIDGDNPPYGSIDIGKTGFDFIQWSDPEPVNIDLALAQIAEMESKARYDAIVSEVEKWPDWKKEAYNALAVSKHAKKLVIGKRKQTPTTWNEIESVEPDISTEQLFARVSDKTGAEEGDIATALYAKHLKEGATK